MGRTVILGASRGLGAQLVKRACADGAEVFGMARKEMPLAALAAEYPGFAYQSSDFAKPEQQALAIGTLLSMDFDRLFYIAAGGPYGAFGERGWKDHQWAMEVSFLFPARLLHALAARARGGEPLPPVVLIGSSVAESAGDPGAVSYAAAKHALKGLYCSLRLEMPDWDIRLFSPGYMDTDMLPQNAPARQGGVHAPRTMAGELWKWALGPDKGGHRVYPKHPV